MPRSRRPNQGNVNNQERRSRRSGRRGRAYRAKGKVNRQTALIFINAFSSRDEIKGTLYFNGEIVSDSDRRALYRWREEGACPVWYQFDGFLCRHDLNWTLFEIWVHDSDLDLWEDLPPDGWQDIDVLEPALGN